MTDENRQSIPKHPLLRLQPPAPGSRHRAAKTADQISCCITSDQTMLRIHYQAVCSAPSVSSSHMSDQDPCCNANFLHFPSKSPTPTTLFTSRLDKFRRGRFHRRISGLCSCKASLGDDNRSHDSGSDDGDSDDKFIEAFLLVSETFRHYNLWKQGFVEETKWHSPGQKHQFSLQGKGTKSDVSSIGHGFLRRFQSPTIFLKIACDGDLLLPLIVGEIAINKLLDAFSDDRHEECPDQYQFVENIVGTFGYEVKMMQITERVANTYYARIFLGKPAKRANISVDARPSDAINVAARFKAPIYVSKEIVLKDAIKLIYGRWRGGGVKTIYDVSLDSAAEGPDALGEELDLVRKMDIAVLEERYEDAAIWRDKLIKLRVPGHEF